MWRRISGLFHPAAESGVGGLPAGRLSCVTGDRIAESACVFRIMANVQAEGGVVGYIDVSNKFDVVAAGRAGVETGRILVSQPDSAETALSVCAALAASGAVDLIVVDSADSLWTEDDMDLVRDPDDDGLPPVKQIVREIAAGALKSGCACLFTGMPANQRRGLSASQKAIAARVRHTIDLCYFPF